MASASFLNSSKKSKKAAKKPVVQWTYWSKATGKEVSERYGKAHPDLVKRKKVQPKGKKPSVKSAINKIMSSVRSQQPLTKRQFLDGLDSTASYLVVARQGSKKGMAIRQCGDVRVHVFPTMEAVLGSAPGYWVHRSEKGYSTRWMNKSEFKLLHDEMLKMPQYQVMPWDTIWALSPSDGRENNPSD